MINILVPTDFSELSKVAIRYAIKIANKINGTLTLLHVVQMTRPVTKSMAARLKPVEEELLENAQKDLEKLARSFSRSIRFTEPVRIKATRGYDSFHDVMQNEVKKLHSGLIVMGTHGASGIKKVVMGSSTAAVIGTSKIPVLAIPEQAEFKGFTNILYASDLRNVEKELKMLIPYAKQFDATVHLLHVIRSGKDAPAIEEKVDKVIAKTGYDNIVVMVYADGSVAGGIDNYIDLSKADMLAMFTHNLSFYERVFDQSHTRRMAFNSKIPLLAFKH